LNIIFKPGKAKKALPGKPGLVGDKGLDGVNGMDGEPGNKEGGGGEEYIRTHYKMFPSNYGCSLRIINVPFRL